MRLRRCQKRYLRVHLLALRLSGGVGVMPAEATQH